MLIYDSKYYPSQFELRNLVLKNLDIELLKIFDKNNIQLSINDLYIEFNKTYTIDIVYCLEYKTSKQKCKIGIDYIEFYNKFRDFLIDINYIKFFCHKIIFFQYKEIYEQTDYSTESLENFHDMLFEYSLREYLL